MVEKDVLWPREWFGTDLDPLEHIRSVFGEKKGLFSSFLPYFAPYVQNGSDLNPIISKGHSRTSFCFFFSLERFPVSILVV